MRCGDLVPHLRQAGTARWNQPSGEGDDGQQQQQAQAGMSKGNLVQPMNRRYTATAMMVTGTEEQAADEASPMTMRTIRLLFMKGALRCAAKVRGPFSPGPALFRQAVAHQLVGV